MDVKEQYSVMFTNYPDIINIEQITYNVNGNIKYFLLSVSNIFPRNIEFNNINAGFINSVGWIEKPNIYIHLFAPLTLKPKIGTSISNKKDIIENKNILFLAKFSFIEEIMNTKNNDISANTIWCLKK